MKKGLQGRKKLIIGFIILFLSMTIFPMTEGQSVEKDTSIKTISCLNGIIISGWMGENGWYRSGVQITWNYTGPVNHTYYKIDNGTWQEYTVPIFVDTEGIHTVWMYLIDHGEYYSDNATFKIDKTNPEITLAKEDVGFGQVKFVANVSDAVSGVWRVEFLVDDEPLFTDFDAPFESDVFWAGDHNVVAFVFDVAGNSKADDLTTPYVIENIWKSLDPTEMSTTSINSYQQNLDGREKAPLRRNVTITFTYPENGIYWNEKKIAPYSVPFILHGNGDLVVQGLRLYRATPVKYTMTGSIVRMEFYFDGTLVGIVDSPPWEFVSVLMTSFSHFNEKIIVYGSNPGEWGSDEITIWRLFI